MPTDRDWVLDVVTGYNTDIDTCTITKGQYKQDQCRAIARVTQSADSRAQNAERREQSAERRAQSAGRGARSAEATQGAATTNVPIAVRDASFARRRPGSTGTDGAPAP